VVAAERRPALDDRDARVRLARAEGERDEPVLQAAPDEDVVEPEILLD
jgi:hypothetical protein